MFLKEAVGLCLLLVQIFLFLLSPLNRINFWQVLMPCLLKILLWYVPCVGKTWWGGTSIVVLTFPKKKKKLHNMLLWRSKIVRFMFLSKFILVKTGPLYILTCFENQSQVAATPMPQTYQIKMVRNVLIRCQWFVQRGLSTYNTSTIFCYNFLRFGSFATTVGKRLRWISTLWLTSA